MKTSAGGGWPRWRFFSKNFSVGFVHYGEELMCLQP